MTTTAANEIFTQLYLKYSTFVYRQVLRMTRSSWLAEELVQEVFLKAWIHREKLETIVDIKSWLFMVTKRKVVDYLIRRSRERKYLRIQADKMVSADDALLYQHCRKIINEAEAKLTPHQRIVYHLKVVKGFDHSQIAGHLALSEFTVIYHLKKSNKIIRNHVLNSVGKRA